MEEMSVADYWTRANFVGPQVYREGNVLSGLSKKIVEDKYSPKRVERTSRLLTAVGLGAAMVTYLSACKDIPFMPRWDADMYISLSTRAIYLNDFFRSGFIPPRISANVSSFPQKQNISGVIRDVLTNIVTDPERGARTVFTLTVAKRTAVSTNDTLYVSSDSSSLTNPYSGRIVFPINLPQSHQLALSSLLKHETLLLILLP